LQRCRDVLYINIFDEVAVDLPVPDRERDQIVKKRMARNWLGSVKIPFSNIYVNGRVSEPCHAAHCDEDHE
jgi:coiled-coil and C2 domain-containing protein 2A